MRMLVLVDGEPVAAFEPLPDGGALVDPVSPLADAGRPVRSYRLDRAGLLALTEGSPVVVRPAVPSDRVPA